MTFSTLLHPPNTHHAAAGRSRIYRYSSPATIIALTLFVTHYFSTTPFRPIQLLYGGDVAPLFLSPFTLPADAQLAPVLSRLLQLAIILLLESRAKSPQCQWAFAELYAAHLSVATLRTAFAFVFNRAVGWTFPSLFIHSAGYEVMSGLGPAILALSLGNSPPNGVAPTSSSGYGRGFTPELLAVIACVLDRAPWSYACAFLAGLSWRLVSFLHRWYFYSSPTCEEYQYELSMNVTGFLMLSTDESSSLPSFTLPSWTVFMRALLVAGLRFSIALCIAAGIVASTAPRPLTDLPIHSPSHDHTTRSTPLLNIIVLSSPRPDASSHLLEDTLESYLPLLRLEYEGDKTERRRQEPIITLTAYTRSEPKDHPAFKHASELDKFKSQSVHSHFVRGTHAFAADEVDEEFEEAQKKNSPNVHFVYDSRLPGESADLYGDAAGLLSFAYSGTLANSTHPTGSTRPEPAEWTMLVEDDFPLCPGPQGGEATFAILSALERRRLHLPQSWRYAAGMYGLDGDEGENETWPRGGWVGTGGSGLIFHRSILRAAAHLLRTPAPLRSSVYDEGEDLRPPPDLIVQSCVLSRPSKTSSTGTVGCGDGGAIISARLAMRHAGSGNSALQHETPSDKWQCGWRHPAHGRPEGVQVIDL